MDKRIIKTKNNIKGTLTKLLEEKPYEDITVKELCEAAQTSRITFYTHYSDKGDVIIDIFAEMYQKALEDYHKLQAENNQAGDIVVSYLNILDCILDTYYSNYYFFKYTHKDKSPTLNYMYFKYMDEHIGQRIERDREKLNPRYSLTMTKEFICSGLRGFISAGRSENMSSDEIRVMARELLGRLLETEVLRK